MSDRQVDALSDALTPTLRNLADLVRGLLERIGPIEERLARIEKRLDDIAELDRLELEEEI